ncbi:MAG: hypothetical protein ACRDPO_24180 [Streptosporangiaceae bacterium]
MSYKITADGDPPWIVRAFRVDGAVPAQFSGTEAETMADGSSAGPGRCPAWPRRTTRHRGQCGPGPGNWSEWPGRG